MAGSDRRDKSEVGRTGARFGHMPANRARDDDEEERGEQAVSAAKPSTGRTGARFGSAEQGRPSVQIPQQVRQHVAPRPQPQPEPEPEWVEVDRTRSIVRPYAWTGGRTETAYDLPLEALISTNRATMQRLGSRMTYDHRSIADLCLATRSVAEVAALCSLPLGVARVVLGDMASAGMVDVHRTKTSAGYEPDLAMMERVLVGLRNL
ncbi:hypothetical protein JOF56_004385 [Kibdelosporangium banguiense]|uniref:DUF742 domain-containing protein n=1 Tax=Kibdelosporangium banguiense TaxID=1365924 RepID=A0ABS4THU1_9PSEU|nr:DUF742 domain-containing protein [Kibdelosporangium banguiense]MBP2324000.1 hypothetical protein [Kibdelosporangium banguiense]